MKLVVINRCWGGFGLSHKAVMLYAKLSKFKLYPFVEKRDASGNIDFHHHVPYARQKNAFVIHYSFAPLNADGTYEEKSYFFPREIERDDAILLRVVKKLGKRANGTHAELKIVEIPNGIEYEIEDYDGMETVEEKHQVWS